MDWFGNFALIRRKLSESYLRLTKPLYQSIAHPAHGVSAHTQADPRIRANWIDSAKGVAIFLVVFGHAWRGCAKADLFETMPPWLFAAIDSRIYAFHMPMFFLISGLFLIHSLERSETLSFLKGRLLRLLWPLVLWTYLFAGAKLLAGEMANTPLAPDDILRSPIPGHWQFWFLWALFLLHMGILVLRPVLLSPRSRRVTLWILLAGSVALTYVGLPSAVNHWTNRALLYLPYLAAGMLLAEYQLVRPVPGWMAWASLGVFLATLALVPSDPLPAISDVAIAMLLCLSLLALLSRLEDLMPGGMHLLALLGTASMAIYLTHTFFSAGIRIVLLSTDVTSLSLHILLGVVAGIVLPMALERLVRLVGRPAFFGF